MKNSTLCSSLLLVMILFTATSAFSQYTIEKQENGFALLKKGKAQKANITELNYFKECNEVIDAFYVQMKKKNALAYRGEGSEGWTFEWVDEVLIPDIEEEFAYSFTGLVHVTVKGKHGIYSCIRNNYLITPSYDNISVDMESGGLLKIEKGKEYSLLPSHRSMRNNIEDELVFAEKISTYDRFFLFEKDGLSNVYIIPDSDSKEFHYVVQFDKGFEGIYDWPIAKKDGKFGLLRLSQYESIPNDKRFYNHEFDTLYFLNDHEVLVGIKDDGYYYFNSAIKDNEGIFYSGYEISVGRREEYLKDKYAEVMSNVDLFHGFWQVNDRPYDNIYEKNNDVFVERDGLYGRLLLDGFNTPSKEQNESLCKSKSDEPAFFRYELPELINDELVSYDLLVNWSNYGKQIYLFQYQDNFRFIGIDPAENSPITLASATTMEQMPNNNYILEDDQYLCFFHYNEELKKVLSYESLAEQLNASRWNERPVPPKSYFEGYELLDLNFLGVQLQTMMDSRGVEYVVTKEFLKKHPKKEDRMEFLSTQQRLSEYRKK